MNTPTLWQTTVSTHDAARRAAWIAIFGENRAPVKSIIPAMHTTPHSNSPEPCYLLDLSALTRPQFEALCTYIAKQFGFTYEFIIDELREKGMPIPASDCTVTSTDSGMMANLLDWPIDDEYNWLSDDEEDCWYEN